MNENGRILEKRYIYEDNVDKRGNMIEDLLIIYICFGLFFPSTYNSIKFIFVCIILVCSFINIVRGRGKIIKESLVWLLIMIGANLLSICVGWYYNNAGVLATVTMDIVWPVFFLICISQVENTFKEKFFNALIITTIVICLYDIGFVLKTFYFTWIPDFLYSFQLNYLIGRNGRMIEYSIEHFYSLYFLTFAMFGLIFSYRKEKNKIENKKIYLPFVLGLICMVLMGKTTGFILFVVIPIAYIILEKIIDHIFIRRNPNVLLFVVSFCVFALFVIILADGMNIGVKDTFSENLAKIARLISNPNDERNMQFHALMSGWYQHPLLGNGTGAYCTDYIRSVDTPWAYELTYILLLFQKGLVGFIVFFTYIIWLYLKLIYMIQHKKLERSYGVAYMLGMLAILISNGMNPTLGKAGLIWIIYLPLVFFNINCNTFGAGYD